MSSTIKLKKKTLYSLIILVILAAIVLTYSLTYLPQQQKESEIISYKQALYESIVCQYNCPLIEGNVDEQGVELLFPDQACVQTCTNNLRDKGFSPDQFAPEDLLTDGLINEIGNAIDGCRNEHITSEAPTTQESQAFFDCAKERLQLIPDNYEYI